MARPPPKVVVYILSISPFHHHLLYSPKISCTCCLGCLCLFIWPAIPFAPICERAEDFLNCLHRAITKNRRKTLAPLIKGSCDLIYVNYSAIVPVRENTPLAQRLFFNIASTSSTARRRPPPLRLLWLVLARSAEILKLGSNYNVKNVALNKFTTTILLTVRVNAH